jgi:hypothetical protein
VPYHSSFSPAVVILPSMALLYVLDQRSLLPEEGADSRPAAGARRPALEP